MHKLISSAAAFSALLAPRLVQAEPTTHAPVEVAAIAPPDEPSDMATSAATRPDALLGPLDLAAAVGASMWGPTGTLRARYDLGGTDLVLDGGLQRGTWFPRGIKTSDVTSLGIRGGAIWTLRDRGPAALEITGLGGVRRIGGSDPLYAIDAEVDASAVVRITPGVRLRAGIAMPVGIETSGGEIDRLEQRLHGGVDVAVGRDVWLTADLHAGGGYGYDGDGAKFDTGAMVGVRVAHVEDPTGGDSDSGVGAFLSTEYRALGIGGHASNGLGFAVGATLLRGHLKVGLAGFNRPGPINRKTFAATPVDGQTWNGQSTVALRSDGNFVGLHVAPTVTFGKLRLEAPITVGQAAFGYYLHGADRDAVKGERVSEVENRLFAGKDSSFAMGAEVGLTAAFQLTEWIAPYASVHYLTTLGYDALGRDSYGGPSAAAGIQLTP